MPNEPVQCPNCGSGDVRQLAPDSYACEHCHTSFHWVSPTKRTVVHKTKKTIVHTLPRCKCGRVATLLCCRCGQNGICEQWEKCQWSLFSTLPSASNAPPGSLAVHLDELLPRFESEVQSEVHDLVRRTAESCGISTYVYLCDECRDGFWNALASELEPFNREAVEKGRLCRECFSSHKGSAAYALSEGQCRICGVGVCSEHGTKCQRCNQFVCKEHVLGDGLCASCGQRSPERMRQQGINEKQEPVMPVLGQEATRTSEATESFLSRFDAGLRQWLGEENAILYRFLQVLLYVVIPIGALTLIVLKLR